jgi:chemotaxis protein MotB
MCRVFDTGKDRLFDAKQSEEGSMNTAIGKGLTVIGAVALTALVSAGCCNKYKDQIASQKEEIEALQISKHDLEEQVALLKSQKDDLEAQLGDVNKHMQDAMQASAEELKKLQAEMKRRQAAEAKRMATLRKMLGQFKKLIEGGKLNVRIRNGKLMLELPSAVLFPSGKAKISDSGMETLKQVADVLKGIKKREFQVAGHTDNVPIKGAKFPTNWELSTARSVAVVRTMQEMGVSPKVLSASGYSEYAPAASNKTRKGKQQNRRIEIILMPNLDELPDLSELEKEIR